AGKADEDQHQAWTDEMVEVVLHSQPEVLWRTGGRLTDRGNETLRIALAIDLAVPAPLEHEDHAQGDTETGRDAEEHLVERPLLVKAVAVAHDTPAAQPSEGEEDDHPRDVHRRMSGPFVEADDPEELEEAGQDGRRDREEEERHPRR